MIYSPSNQRFDVCVDASFTGYWDPDTTSKVRTGYVILHASCPVIWASKLQIDIALLTAEAEYLAISTSTCKVLPHMELI
jgi:hypothetical protein